MNIKSENASMLNLYSVFHLNLSYSSIHEEDHIEVVENCYTPLLDLHEKLGLPFGIELTGYTLERIAELDSSWIDKLKELCRKGLCNLLASGYSQIIGPLVPQKVNEKNLETGLKVYKEILSIEPKIAYVNEQAFSSGLADVYIDMGFGALFMEWNNVYSAHKDLWSPDFQYYPQYAVSSSGRKLPVIWNNAVSFQRLQRFIHGEISSEEYISYLESHTGGRGRNLCMYGNDAEIFDFRPGRYHTETELDREGEWKRFERLIETIKGTDLYDFVLPTHVIRDAAQAAHHSSSITHYDNKNAFNKLKLSTSAQPVPVKKQSKYNITRWALTGRDDVRNNGACFKLYSLIEQLSAGNNCSQNEIDEYWKEFCYLWGSDFRTHITDEKYTDFIKRIGVLEYKLKTSHESQVTSHPSPITHHGLHVTHHPSHITAFKNGHYLTVETPTVKISVNSRRGMAIDSLTFKESSDIPLIGTLHQGYFNDMTWGVDLYSGHVIVQPVNQPKITDLETVDIVNHASPITHHPSRVTTLSCSVRTSLGIIYKTISIFDDKPKIEIEYVFEWNGLKDASFHAGIMTLNPEAFDEETLYYATHNGGPEEKYYLEGQEFNHSQAVAQSVISATHCLGATEGIVRIGDKDKALIIRADKYPVSAQPMVEFHKVDDKFLLRLYHSLGEHDETSYWMFKGRTNWKMSVELEK